jgi:hypothetical protein
LLARPDKWYLGAGDGLIWAPPFPVWLDAPGFWDEAHLFQYAVGPLFTVAFVTNGVTLPGRARARHWTPAALTLDYDIGTLRARETRHAPGGALVSEWEVRNATRRPVALDVVVWSALDAETLAPDVRAAPHALDFTRLVTDRHGHHARVEATLSLQGAQSHAVYRSQLTAPQPRFELTPFWDRWRGSGRLGNEVRAGDSHDAATVFLGLHRRVRVPARGTARFAAGISLRLETGRHAPTTRRVPSSAERFFATVPGFRCSDPYLERHWWHRWYGLRLNGLAAGAAPNYRHAGVCEGIGYFHVPITYSAPCHMRELRWYPDPEWARGVFRTCFDHQRADGSLHGRVYADHLEGTDFYHADWGGAVLALDAVHPDAGFRRDAYAALARYAEWLLRTRDPDSVGMIDVRNQFETGQEYMSRYQAVDLAADRVGWAGRFRLQGIDVTVYAYRLLRALESLADEVAPETIARWHTTAERTAQAVRERMWDPANELFSDVDPASGRRTGVKAAVCFYPYATDLAGERHVRGLERHLFNPEEFWTPFPVPSSSRDDPRFNPDGEWNGMRHNCPWNGRVWPMTNSHLADALGRVVRELRPDWAPKLGRLLSQFARMMTVDGQADRPNCYEHYHPVNGRGSLYRGIDDYQHSWINDLIVSHLIGVLPHGGTGLTVHPLRLGIGGARLTGLPVAGHRVDVGIAEGRFAVTVDGRRAGRARVGEPLSVSF